eukprot:TRINITY_DN28360_c0_g1_i2.p1 TRINITY_DN28360_c0_g1~~TRINITY_DN28360_c0_g1_i2.p1  ORF type:complete len:592 (+),score=131.28 TRINITY_DN28360_c0_g1_i2:158-1933(+)
MGPCWSDVLEGSFGLCMLEVMQLDVPTTRRFMNDCVSFHFDIVQSLSRQYMISSVAFALSCAMAGLFPVDFKSVQNYPEQGKYCRMLNQHLVRKPYRIRLAELSDLPVLEKLEQKVWAENLRASSAVLRTRLETAPTCNLVCELDGEVVAVLYMQRISKVEHVDSEKFMQISEAHTSEGRVLQLIAMGSDPQVSGRSIGADLRAFALLLARLDPEVDCVIGVTRCAGFSGELADMQQYIEGHVTAKHSDKTLAFHTGYGAQVVRLVPDFRPEDTANHGVGVLIRYDVKDWVATESSAASAKGAAQHSHVSALGVVREILMDLGHNLADDQLGQGFLSLGIDSLEMVRIRNRLTSWLGRELPATLLLDYPSQQELAEELDRIRGIKDPAASLSAQDAILHSLKELGYTPDTDDFTKGFMQLGIDSLEIVRIRAKLSAWAGQELEKTLLLDFPNIQELAEELQKRRGEPSAAAETAAVGEVESAWRKLGADELKTLQEKLLKLYSLPQHQKKLAAQAEKHLPDRAKYFTAIEPVLLEVEGPVLVSFGLVDDLKPAAVQKARKCLPLCVKRLGRKEPEFLAREQELLKLLKLAD